MTKAQPSVAQMAALVSFAKRNGRCWRARLYNAWCSGRDALEPEGALLRQLRNDFGPKWLARVKLPKETATPLKPFAPLDFV